jgi:hypothetical protein
MSSKRLAIQSGPEVPENWAKSWQVSGRCHSASATAGRRDRARNRAPRRPRKLLIMVCVLTMPCAAFARTDQASWENLSAIGAGHKIQVLELNSKKVSGTFVDFSSTSISLRERSGAQTILRQDVRSVTLRENHHRLRNTLIGTGVGAGAGAGIAATTWENHGFFGNKGTGATVGAVIGAIGGAIVGALWPSHKTVYRSAGQ